MIPAFALIGLVIGSFINVVAYRVPAGVSIVWPPSSCPHCGEPIKPYDNVPVLAWFLLRGRCRSCGAAISVRYPIVEALTAAAFATTAWVIGFTWTLPAYLWFVGVCIVLTLTDFDHQRIPNKILYPGLAVGTALLAGGAVADSRVGDFGRGVLGGVAFFVLLLVIALAARGGFGFGDVKLAALLGEFLAFMSWSVWLVGIFLAFMIGGGVAVVLLAAGRRGRKDAIPFGPALVAGAFVALVFGQRLADWYLG